MPVLSECEAILCRQPDSSGGSAQLRGRALRRIAVLSELAKQTCELAVAEEGDPVRAVTLVCHIDALVDGLEGLHRLLRQACPDEADAVVKGLADVKRGTYRNLSHDVRAQIDYTLPVAWACVPALRTVVQLLKEFEQLSRDDSPTPS